MISHIRSLAQLIRQHCDTSKPLMGVEIGVLAGRLSYYTLGSFPTLTLWMIDPWEDLEDRSYEANDYKEWTPEFVDERMQKLVAARELAEQRTEKFADRRIIRKMTSEQALDHFEPASLDFAFIDGNHRYEAVKFDIENWSPKVKPGGIICGHDYGGTGDKKGYFGVDRAVDEYAKDHRYVVGSLPGYVWWWIKSGGRDETSC